jgi:hypothetical protein
MYFIEPKNKLGPDKHPNDRQHPNLRLNLDLCTTFYGIKKSLQPDTERAYGIVFEMTSGKKIEWWYDKADDRNKTLDSIKAYVVKNNTLTKL